MSLVLNMRQGSGISGLNNLCSFVKTELGEYLNIVEIGSYCGASTQIIANNFINGKINAVDPWQSYTEEGNTYYLNRQALELQEAEIIFDKIIINYKNIIKNKCSSIDYANKIEDESVDFVYIDGNHQYTSVIEDIKIWYPKVKKNGIISGHDWSWDTVRKAVLDSFNNKMPNALFEDTSWLYKK